MQIINKLIVSGLLDNNFSVIS